MEEQLLDLYARLSREAARMQVYMLRAKKDDQPALARLFKALEHSHNAQANRLLMQLRGFIDTSEKNLASVIEDELPGFIARYRELERKATADANKAVATGCNQANRISRMNINLADRIREGRSHKSYHICDFCGFISADRAPENCPICTAASHRFIRVD